MKKIIVKTWGENLRLVLNDGKFGLETLVYEDGKGTWDFLCLVRETELESLTHAAYETNMRSFVALVRKCHLIAGNDEEQFEIEAKWDALKEALSAWHKRFAKGRDYLMGVNPAELTVADAMEAFGYTRDGLSER